jgi:hypothetical protein
VIESNLVPKKGPIHPKDNPLQEPEANGRPNRQADVGQLSCSTEGRAIGVGGQRSFPMLKVTGPSLTWPLAKDRWLD